MTCSYCNHQINVSDKFCPNCGREHKESISGKSFLGLLKNNRKVVATICLMLVITMTFIFITSNKKSNPVDSHETTNNLYAAQLYSTPEEVISEFIEAVNSDSGDIEAIKNLISKSKRDFFESKSMDEILSNINSIRNSIGNPQNNNIRIHEDYVTENEEGTWIVSSSGSDGLQHDMYVSLVYENNEWKIKSIPNLPSFLGSGSLQDILSNSVGSSNYSDIPLPDGVFSDTIPDFSASTTDPTAQQGDTRSVQAQVTSSMPNDVVLQFINATSTGDIETTITLISSSKRNFFIGKTQSEQEADLEEFYSWIVNPNAVSIYKENGSEDEGTWVVDVSTTASPGMPKVWIDLVKEDSGWKIKDILNVPSFLGPESTPINTPEASASQNTTSQSSPSPSPTPSMTNKSVEEDDLYGMWSSDEDKNGKQYVITLNESHTYLSMITSQQGKSIGSQSYGVFEYSGKNEANEILLSPSIGEPLSFEVKYISENNLISLTMQQVGGNVRLTQYGSIKVDTEAIINSVKQKH